MKDFKDAELTFAGFFTCQVCVPKDWDDDKIVLFANTVNPSGVSNGWAIMRTGNEHLLGEERVQCEKHSHRMHIVLEC